MTPEGNFESGARANLKEAYIAHDAHGKFLCGTIYADSTKTYEDGEKVITSYLIVELMENVWLTRNGMTYFADMKEKPDEAKI